MCYHLDNLLAAGTSLLGICLLLTLTSWTWLPVFTVKFKPSVQTVKSKKCAISKHCWETKHFQWFLLLWFLPYTCKWDRFLQRMCLMSLQMRRMRPNAVILAIQQQQQNNTHCRKHKTMWVYPRLQFWFKPLVLLRLSHLKKRYQEGTARQNF